MDHKKLVIIGSGPAGYAAGVYAARAKLEPHLFAGYKSGGQLMWTTEVENYPGYANGILGPDLMMAMRGQAEKFGATIEDTFVTAVDFSKRPFTLWTSLPADLSLDFYESATQDEIHALTQRIKAELAPSTTADAIIVSTGAVAIPLGVPGEKEFLARGVSTCAVCDAAFFKEKQTFVVGGGDSAMEDAMALTKFAAKVTIIHRRDSFRASQIMQQRVLENKKVSVLWNTTVNEIRGAEKVTEIVVNENGSQKTLPADGVFIAIGHTPMNQIFHSSLEMDAHGYIVTRQSATAQGVNAAQSALTDDGLVAYPSMTSVEGVFAAGDNVDVRYKQAITAAGQGCTAALDAERWLERQ